MCVWLDLASCPPHLYAQPGPTSKIMAVLSQGRRSACTLRACLRLAVGGRKSPWNASWKRKSTDSEDTPSSTSPISEVCVKACRLQLQASPS